MLIVKYCKTQRKVGDILYTYNRLRGRIVEVYGSMKSFHEEERDKLGISYTSMSQKMNGKCSFSQEDIDIWRELLGLDLKDIGEYFFT